MQPLSTFIAVKHFIFFPLTVIIITVLLIGQIQCLVRLLRLFFVTRLDIIRC